MSGLGIRQEDGNKTDRGVKKLVLSSSWGTTGAKKQPSLAPKQHEAFFLELS